jgi:hypothetical protein
MNFVPILEQRLIIDITRALVETELYPHEPEIERTDTEL